MLESLHIRNFQRHEDKLIEFDPITTIVGPTDRGKSSIIWALSWVCYNVPEGTDFITHGETEAQATLNFDGHEVKRRRAKKENTYTLDGQEPSFKAFGAGVPEPIVQLLNLHECSFQHQLDNPFWLADKGRSVAEQMNAIINLSVMDETLEASNKLLRSEKGTMELAEHRLQSLQSEQQELEWVLACSAEIENLEQKHQEVETLERELLTLKRFHDALCKCNDPVQKKRLSQLKVIVEQGKKVRLLNLELHTLQQAQRRLRETQAEIEKPAMPLSILRQIKKDYEIAKQESLRLQYFQMRLEEVNEELTGNRKQLATIQQRIPKRCPQCQQPLIPSVSTSPTSTSTKRRP